MKKIQQKCYFSLKIKNNQVVNGIFNKQDYEGSNMGIEMNTEVHIKSLFHLVNFK